jgi:hypothetical protein
MARDRLYRHAEGLSSLALQVQEILHRDPAAICSGFVVVAATF